MSFPVFSKEAFREFCLKKGEEEFDYGSCDHCAYAQYMASLGFSPWVRETSLVRSIYSAMFPGSKLHDYAREAWITVHRSGSKRRLRFSDVVKAIDHSDSLTVA